MSREKPAVIGGKYGWQNCCASPVEQHVAAEPMALLVRLARSVSSKTAEALGPTLSEFVPGWPRS
jgi:hypothetical protein